LIQCFNSIIEVWNPESGTLVACFLKVSTMTEVSIKFYSRNANQVAHELAKFAYVSKNPVSGIVTLLGLFFLLY
jgi:hypothetical protein